MNQTDASSPLLNLLSRFSDAARRDASQEDTATLAIRAERLIEYALAEYERIAELDLAMGRLSLRYTDPQGAAAMRAMYQQWSVQADELLERVRSHGLHDRLSTKYDALERAVGRTLAMLNITLQSLADAEQQFKTGQSYSSEEVRRELRAAAGR